MRLVDRLNLRKFGIILLISGVFIPSILYPFTSLTPSASLATGRSAQKGVIYKTRINDLEILLKEGKPKLGPEENLYYFAGEYDGRLAIPYKYPFTFGIMLFFIGITINTPRRIVSLIRNYVNTNRREIALFENYVFYWTIIISIPVFFFSLTAVLYTIKTLFDIDFVPGVHMGKYLGL